MRAASLETLRRYTDNSIRLADAVPGSDAEDEEVSAGEELQRRLWALAGRSLDGAPEDTAPRLYVESLNQMIDQRTVRTASLNNRTPPCTRPTLGPANQNRVGRGNACTD